MVGRPEGFLWAYPGIQSLTVPYPDINDFYFSGHVGTCMLISLEFRAMKFYKFSYFAGFTLVTEWIIMTFLRTHYISDLVSGVIFAQCFHIIAERLIYFFDYKVIRLKKDHRASVYFEICEKCGWTYSPVEKFMDKQEIKERLM